MEATNTPDAPSESATTSGAELNDGASMPEGIEAEIAEGVAAVMARKNDAAGDEEEPTEGVVDEVVVEDEPAEESVESEGSDAPDVIESEAAPAADSLSDEVTERAIRAGFSLKEIKQCPGDAFLNAMCDRIEGSTGDAGSPSGADDVDEAEPSVDDILSQIPDLDPEGYEPALVDGFKNMKAILKQQLESNKSLREANANLVETVEGMRGDRTKDWLSTQIDGVKDLTKGDADKVAALKEEYDVLKAGYKARGKDVADEAVFEKAVKLALGKELGAANRKRKTDSARSRNGQFISKVSGNRVTSKTDYRTRIGAVIDSRTA